MAWDGGQVNICDSAFIIRWFAEGGFKIMDTLVRCCGISRWCWGGRKDYIILSILLKHRQQIKALYYMYLLRSIYLDRHSEERRQGFPLLCISV